MPADNGFKPAGKRLSRTVASVVLGLLLPSCEGTHREFVIERPSVQHSEAGPSPSDSATPTDDGGTVLSDSDDTSGQQSISQSMDSARGDAAPEDACGATPEDACRSQGEPCGPDLPACKTGLSCADGVCCDRACDGPCERCGAAGMCVLKRPQSYCGPGEQCDVEGSCVFTGLGMIAAGTAHTCALTSAGTVRCWGDNTDGLLGYGHTIDIGDDETPLEAAREGYGGDIDFGNGERVLQVSAGTSYTCALFESGGVRCWGGLAAARQNIGTLDVTLNAEGLLVPSAIGDVDLGRRAVHVNVSSNRACAVLEGGAMGCWGPGVTALGTGTLNPVFANPGANVLLGEMRARQAVSGGAHACALIEPGHLSCWAPGSTPLTTATTPSGFLSPPPAVALAAGEVIQITSGLFHVCAVTVSGAGFCWGQNNAGQLGYFDNAAPTLSDQIEPGTSRALPLSSPILQVEAGTAGFDLTCALLLGGAVQCWGVNDAAQLGYGHDTPLGTRGAGAFGNLALDQPAIALADGARCAVLADRSIRCWGSNHAGVLGQGRTELLAENGALGATPVAVEY